MNTVCKRSLPFSIIDFDPWPRVHPSSKLTRKRVLCEAPCAKPKKKKTFIHHGWFYTSMISYHRLYDRATSIAKVDGRKKEKKRKREGGVFAKTKKKKKKKT